MTRSAREVVELYNLVVWNEREFALADELMGETVIRHEVGEAQTLTHERAVQRIVDNWACRFLNRVSSPSSLTCDDASRLRRCHRAFVSSSCHFFGTPLPVPLRHIQSLSDADQTRSEGSVT